MQIETNRLLIRSFKEEDADALYMIKVAPRVMEFCPDFLDIGVRRGDIQTYIQKFQEIEIAGDIEKWRCYAIEHKDSRNVVGVITFCKHDLLHEYNMGWMMNEEYTGKGYASEAAEAFAEDFCRIHRVPYITAIMDIDNPASYRVAEKSGFQLFEKRTVYDHYYERYTDDYFYFRRYWTGCNIKNRYHGDIPYNGRSTSSQI